MEKLNAIAQISVLLIVAFIIGFVTSWLYWHFRNRQLSDSFEDKLRDKDRELSIINGKLEQTLNEKNETERRFKKEVRKVETVSNSNLPEEMYQAIVKDVGEGISLSDEEGDFLVFNPELEQITGYTHAEANQHKHKLFLDKLYPDEKLRSSVTDHIHHIPEGHKHTNIKTVIKSKSGKDITILVSSTIMEYKEKKYYLTAYKDLSEKPEIEKRQPL